MNVQSKAMSVQVVDLKTHNYLLFFIILQFHTFSFNIERVWQVV